MTAGAHAATIVLASLALVTAGCAVGPSTRVAQRAAAVRTAQGIPGAEARSFLDSLAAAREGERADTASDALWRPEPLALDQRGDVHWLEVLRDSQLVALVRTAVANNRDLRAAMARVREYRALLGAARGDLFPQISANGAVSTNQIIFGAFPPQTFDVVRVTADLSWELDFWGRLRRRTQAAGFDYRGRDEDLRAAVVTLVAEVASAYLELRELDENLRIAEQTLASRRATLELARQRFAQGVISELDVRQFEAEAAAPAASLADFAQRRARQEHLLRVLLGQEPGPIVRGGPLDATVQAVAVPDSLPSDLLLRRPDVLRAQHDWQAALARVGVAVGNRLPAFFVSGQYGTQRPELNGLFGSSGEIYSVEAGVSIPLFTGGRLVNEQRAARARAEQAQAAYEQTVLGAAREASDALAGLRLRRDQLAAQETQVHALRRAYELAERRYQSGVSSYLEVLEAQRGLFNAELALVQVQRQYLDATVELYRALGGGWETGD
jgi:multidrug efflux system outer membrane protein